MKHLKKLGLVAGVVMALAAFTGVASASAAEFHATSSGVAITGEQTTEHVFTTQGEKVTCETAKFTGKTEGTASTTQKMKPSYSGCTAFGFVGATVSTEGCVYTFHSSGSVDLGSCEGGHATIKISVPFVATCEVQVPDQTGIGGQSFATSGSAPSRTISETSAATGIESTVTKSTGSCPLTTGSTTSRYTGVTHITPESGEIWFE